MKTPLDEAEKAFLLGKASQYCKKIDQIFIDLGRENGRIDHSLFVIENEIKKGIMDLHEPEGGLNDPQ